MSSGIAIRGGDSTPADPPGSDVYAVALDVPADAGPIRALRFEVPEGPMEAPLFYAATLEREGVTSFQKSFTELIDALDAKATELRAD